MDRKRESVVPLDGNGWSLSPPSSPEPWIRERAGSAIALTKTLRAAHWGIFSCSVVRLGRTAVAVGWSRPGRLVAFYRLLSKLERYGAGPDELAAVQRVCVDLYPDDSPAVREAERVLRKYFPKASGEVAKLIRRALRAAPPPPPVWHEPFRRHPFERAQAAVVRELPFLAAAVFALSPVKRPGIGTASVDAARRCYYDPDWAAALPVAEFAGVLYHEVCHLLRLHFQRGESVGAEPRLWNLACDLEINDQLFPATPALWISLLPNTARPEAFGLGAGLLAEE